MTNSDDMKFLSPAHSALYRGVDGLIFMREKYACKVDYLYEDANSRNLKIKNLDRLKKILFDQIWLNYNNRIKKYKLEFDDFHRSKIEDLEIIGHKLIPSMQNESSGIFKIHPRTFVCSKCGDFRNLNNNEWNNFNPNKCRNPQCDGKYEQVSILMFCEVCGTITNLFYNCPEHGTEYIKLIREKKDSLLTWRMICKKCQNEKKQYMPKDIIQFPCSHKDFEGNVICNEKKKKFKPLTIREGGVMSSFVITTVDIPPTESIELDDFEFILLGLYLGKFNHISKKKGSEINLNNIEEYYHNYNSDSEFIDREGIKKAIKAIKLVIDNIKEKYDDIDLEKLNDYFVIKNLFSNAEEKYDSKTYDQYLNELPDEMMKKMKKENYIALKEEFGIEDITYISDINLISSAIGTISGINQFYTDDFVPHFNPLWKDRKKDKFLVYTYPFETEGILIDLDKIKVCEWLINNSILNENTPKTNSEALEILLKLNKDTYEYDALKTLLHSLSHTLISRSSLYTGLNSDSCSEIIFVNSAAFLIYSTSNINIGGFLSVFENSIPYWFDKVKLEINDCTFDPTCLIEKGACFSCLYLPEFVCSEFNQCLDRDVFIGRRRYDISYW